MDNHTTREIAEKYKHCVCKIYTYLNNILVSQGSGVFLKNKKIIVTNYHIFIGSNKHKVVLQGNVISKSKIVSINIQKDLLLIYISPTIKDMEEITINSESNMGEKVYTFGYPLNYELTMSEGIVSRISADIRIKMSDNYFTKEIIQSNVIQITAAIFQGNSGGALVNENGELIGITTYSDKVGLGINFAISAKEVLVEIDDFEKLKIDKSSFKKLNAIDNFCLGVNLMENGNFNHAYKLSKRAYTVLHNNRNLLYFLVFLAGVNLDYKNALKFCDKLIRIENLSLRAINVKAYIYLAMGKNREALSILSLGIKFYPTNPYTLHYKALAYFGLKKFLFSLNEIDKAIELEEGNYEFLKLKAEILENRNDFENAIKQYEYLLTIRPNEEHLNLKLGSLNSELGYNKKSLQYFDNLVKIDGTDNLNFYNRARIHYLLENYQSAIEDLLVSINLNPKHELSYFNIALCYSEVYNELESINYYTKCISLNPNYIDAINNRGIMFLYLNNYASALSDFKTVVKISPNDYKAANNIIICLQNLKQYKKAKLHFDTIKKPKKPDSVYYVNRALIFYNIGNKKKALADFAKAEKLDSENSYIYLKRSRILLELELFKEAIQDANKIIDILPLNGVGYLIKAKILLKSKKYNMALEFAEKAICLSPDIGESYFLRGEIYSALGKSDLAMIEFNISVKLDNDDPEYFVAFGRACKNKGYNSLASFHFEQACVIDSTYCEKVKRLMGN